MDTRQRYVIDGRNRDCMSDLIGIETEQFARPGGSRDGELDGMVEPFRHYRDNRGDAAPNLIGNCEGEHEVLATGRRVVSRGQDRAEVVTG